MRGTTNRYEAEAVKLFGTVVKWIIKINYVPCLELIPSKKPGGYAVLGKQTLMRVNWKLVEQALKNAS